MIRTEKTPIADADLPVEAFKDHLRLGTGFSDESLQDPVLRGFLRAAIVAVEGRIGRILFKREFDFEVSKLASHRELELVMAPVRSIEKINYYNVLSGDIEVDLSHFHLEASVRSARLIGPFPQISQGGKLTVTVCVGLADGWDDLPADLAQAIFLLATHYYEHRTQTSFDAGCTPFGVLSLIERYKAVRLSLGGGQ